MNKIRCYILGLLLTCTAVSQAQSFVTVENGRLYRDRKPSLLLEPTIGMEPFLVQKVRGGTERD